MAVKYIKGGETFCMMPFPQCKLNHGPPPSPYRLDLINYKHPFFYNRNCLYCQSLSGLGGPE